MPWKVWAPSDHRSRRFAAACDRLFRRIPGNLLAGTYGDVAKMTDHIGTDCIIDVRITESVMQGGQEHEDLVFEEEVVADDQEEDEEGGCSHGCCPRGA